MSPHARKFFINDEEYGVRRWHFLLYMPGLLSLSKKSYI